MTSNLKKNISYNVIYQILNIIMPLVTTPYIARVIGVNGVGIYSYTYAIVQYFVLFIMLGLNNYGNRTIAKSRDNINSLSKNFWNIYTVQFVCFIVVSAVYWIYVFSTNKEYQIFFIIQYLFILASGIDINWFFYGLEEFKVTITRNIFIKFILMILIFVLVKNEDGLVLYTILMSMATLLSNGILWFYRKKMFDFKKAEVHEVIMHFKKNIILFIPVLAVSFYNIMDKIMVGNILNVTEVGLYENAEKIINVPLNILTALGTVMLPRMTNLVANKMENKVIEYINKTMKVSLFLAVPTIIGIYIVADKAVTIYLGQAFSGSIILVQFLSIIILFKIWANIIRTQYLIPKERDISYIISVIIGAILNVIFNIIFIRKFGTIGAVYGTIIAELSVCIVQTLAIVKELPILLYLKYLFRYGISSIVMGGILVFERSIMNRYNINSWIYLCILVLSGIISYSLMNYRFIKTTCKEILVNKI
ncbi:MAG: flippase [Clostridiales bacterium]|nr:flippase [Clostridiales bacterium]